MEPFGIIPPGTYTLDLEKAKDPDALKDAPASAKAMMEMLQDIREWTLDRDPRAEPFINSGSVYLKPGYEFGFDAYKLLRVVMETGLYKEYYVKHGVDFVQ